MKFKKFLSLILAVSMIATCIFSGTVSAAEEKVLFHETFDADLNSAYWSVNGAAVSDGAMKVATGKWPVLWLTYLGITYDPLKSYEFSYRVKFTSEAGLSGCSWKCYDYNNCGAIYGGAAVGKGFGFETLDPNYSVKEGFEANAGKWYTVKTEMRTDAATRYIKRTLLGEDGSEIASYSDTNIYKSPSNDKFDSKVAFGSDEQIINQICFWNDALTDDVLVDDIIIKEVEPSVVPVENNLIFEETFANNTFDNASSWSQHTAVVDNGALKVPGNSWTVMTMPTPSNKDAAYKFSYRIKTDSNTSGTLDGDLFRVVSTDYKRAFGSYKPGSGAIFRNSLWSTEVASAPWELFEKDEWYTFETTFCEKSGSQYTKWSIKNANGDEIYADSVNYLPDALTPGTADDSGSVFGKGMYFWNVDSTGNVTFWIDDIKLEKVQIEEIEEEISFVDEKFDAADLSGLSGWSGAVGGVSIDNGTLKMPQNSYIYLNIPNKNGNDTYKITYDVMVDGETNSAANSIALISDYFLGNFNPLTGLGNTFGFKEPNEIISVTNGNGKWYTVSVEFCESKDNGFMRYSLTDRETGTLIGTHLCPYLKSSQGAADVSGMNATSYYFWNRGATGTVAYIDNLKFIRTSNAMYLDKITVTDYAGNVLSLDDGISPAVENIKVGFTAKVTDASANGGISLKEKASNTDVDFALTSDGKNAVLTFAAPLKGNTEYQLVVSKDVKSANGTALIGESIVDFVTGAADTLGRIKPLGVSDIASLTPGGTLNVEASIANAESESRDAVIIAAFYSNGVLCSVQNGSTEKVNAASVKDIAFTVNVPKDMKDVTCVKVFLWSGFDGMEPYCAFAELNAPTEQ